MNLQNIFKAIEATDPEVFEKLDSRRNVMHRFKNLGGKLALTAIPVALGSMLNKAYGQVPSSVVDILNFALKLEYLEQDFYAKGTTKNPDLIDPPEVPFFNLILQHETAHVNFLTATIISLGGSPIDSPQFSFTAGGTYANVFTDYQTFLALSQTFEDTGVRAYKGQLTGLISNNDVLTAAMRIQSVEARHAAHVRQIRRILNANSNEKPWITGNESNVRSSLQPSYDGEDNTMQLGIDVSSISSVLIKSATESFDEPLTMDEVNAIIEPFIK